MRKLPPDYKIVEVQDGITRVTITSRDSTLLTRVYLMSDGDKIELYKTEENNLWKNKLGEVYKTRTLLFKDTGSDLELAIERMTYTEIYNKTVDIPID